MAGGKIGQINVPGSFGDSGGSGGLGLVASRGKHSATPIFQRPETFSPGDCSCNKLQL